MSLEDIARDLVGRLRAEGGIADILALGGPVVLLLVGLSVVMIAVSIIKLLQFAQAGVGRHGRAEHMVDAWLDGDTTAIRRRGPLSNEIVSEQIEAGGTTDAAREIAESLAAMRLHHLRRLVGLIDTIAQISPLLGLFGTVLGMIEAFQALEGAGASVDPSILAGGIWVALLTTAVGLAVAMPASVIAAWLDARLENERMMLDNLITRVATRTRRAPAHARPAAIGAPNPSR